MRNLGGLHSKTVEDRLFEHVIQDAMMINDYSIYVMGCEIWCHLYNLKNVKNTHGGVLLFVKLQAKPELD